MLIQKSFFARLKYSLLKTKKNLGSGFISIFNGIKTIDENILDMLEERLLISDININTTNKIIGNIVQKINRKQLRDSKILYDLLKQEMKYILKNVDQSIEFGNKLPFIILIVGVNGVGKTTTIGKLTYHFKQQNKSVILAAGDTFRSAAIEQLKIWGDRNKVVVISQHTGSDSASVIFDAIHAAKARKIDILIADTAGRLHNKIYLMEELQKIVRVIKKLDESAPHEIMIIIDSNTGQNAINQTKIFNETLGLTGITLTKLDGTAKGGVIFTIADYFNIPIRYIGIGEKIDDLRPFNAEDFIEALFS